jgi:hypothetical protein
VMFKYEKLPVFYFQCGQILHEPDGCPARFQKQKNHQSGTTEWGAWMRAADLYIGSELSEGHRSGKPSTYSEEETRALVKEGPINADSNPKGRRANSCRSNINSRLVYFIQSQILI